MKKALDFIVSSIVEKPKEVKITEEGDDVITYTITVDKDDMGRIIGKNGKVIKAIRNVLKIPAIKQGKKIYVNLNEIPQEL